jgi:exosome complex RNA-binding protein Rrp42 (RNase PH superfamily)
MLSSNYISIRDDGRSLSLNERNFVRDGAFSSRRIDGRGPGDLRKIKLHLSRKDNGAECTVQWGETRVSAEITASLQPPPSEDRPSEGMVSITVDTSPMASSAFGMMPPLTTTPGEGSRPNFMSTADDSQKLLGNRILRCLERTILVGGALDTEALCVQAGAWVWKLSLSVKILDQGGNLLDAAVLAAMASLRHYRKPQVDVVEAGMPLLIASDTREPTPLPLHHTPLAISFALIHADDVALSTSSTLTVAVLVDPTEREELVQTGSISIAMNLHAEVCLLDFGGGCELQPTQLKECWQLAEKCIRQLCQLLETSLVEADEKAQRERLHRLQEEQHGLPPLPANGAPQVPFWSEDGDMQVDTASPFADTSQEVKNAADKVKDQVQENYRLQALEYNQGHVAAKVKENDKTKKKKQEGSTLLAAMLQSVKKVTDATHTQETNEQHDTMQVEPASGETGVTSSEQKDEFENFAKAAKEKMNMDLDDEEEEEAPTMLTSEFEAVKTTKPEKAVVNDEDVDDLAMAIKNKKKKKKKSSS